MEAKSSMDASLFQAIKLIIVLATGPSKDALHIHVGVATYLALVVLIRLYSSIPASWAGLCRRRGSMQGEANAICLHSFKATCCLPTSCSPRPRLLRTQDPKRPHELRTGCARERYERITYDQAHVTGVRRT